MADNFNKLFQIDELKKEQEQAVALVREWIKEVSKASEQARIASAGLINPKDLESLAKNTRETTKATQEHTKAVEGAVTATAKMTKSQAELEKASERARKSIEKEAKVAQKEAEATRKELDKLAKQYERDQKRAADRAAKAEDKKRMQAEAQAARDLRKEMAQLEKEMRKSDAEAKKLESAYGRLNIQHKEAMKTARDLGASLGFESQEFKEAADKANLLDQQLKKIDSHLGQHQRNVGNYASAYNGLGTSLGYIASELPNLSQGFDLFLRAIGNNIGQVYQDVKQLREENAKLIAQGQASIPIWTQVGKAIFSWQTAVYVAVAAVVTYGGKFIDWLTGVSAAAERAEMGMANFSRSIKTLERDYSELQDGLTRAEKIEVARLRAKGASEEEITATIQSNLKQRIANAQDYAKKLKEIEETQGNALINMRRENDKKMFDPYSKEILQKQEQELNNTLQKRLAAEKEAEDLKAEVLTKGYELEGYLREENERSIEDAARKREQDEKKREQQLDRQKANLESVVKYFKQQDDWGLISSSKPLPINEQMESLNKLTDEAGKNFEELKKQALENMGAMATAMSGPTESWEEHLKAIEKNKKAALEFLSVVSNIAEVSANLSQGRVMNIEREIQALDGQRDKELENTSLTAEQKAVIEANYANQRTKLEKERRDEIRQTAQLEKNLALAKIFIETAAAVAEALPDVKKSIAVGIIGAAQYAAVASRPIPEYWTGTDSSEAGLAWVGERGREMFVTPSGQIGLTPDVPTLVNLQGGTQIIDNDTTNDLIAAAVNGISPTQARNGGSLMTDTALLAEIRGLRHDIKNMPKDSFVFKKGAMHQTRTEGNHITHFLRRKI